MQKGNQAMDELLEGEEVREVLAERFYRATHEPAKLGLRLEPAPEVCPAPRKARRRAKAEKPDHYRVICISIYEEDLGRLDEKVKELKAQGHRKMSRSALIRYALDHVDLRELPRSY
ncbi:MAG: hypothetical protein OEY14_16035 [Myxococcales bacterium]|nr:hypothetical protein [Myxococcales bacterium]